jgi:hypothetical protein
MCAKKRLSEMGGIYYGSYTNIIVLNIANNYGKRHNPLEMNMAKGKHNPPL